MNEKHRVGSLSNWYLEEQLDFDKFYEMGKDFPDDAAELYAVCSSP